MRSGWTAVWGISFAAAVLSLGSDANADAVARRTMRKHERKDTVVPTPVMPPAIAQVWTEDPIMGGADRIADSELNPPNMVAFTFDDGPHRETTPIVMKALEDYDIPASFFIVTRHLGNKKYAAETRKLIEEEVAKGFLVGSHTEHHANLGSADEFLLAREVDGSLAMLAPVVNEPIGMFRPPYGRLSTMGRDHIKQLGLTEVRWSIDPRDWESKKPMELRRKILAQIVDAGGGVVLLHDPHEVTAQIVGQVFDDLERYNCSRIAGKKAPIVPVSLHYFLRDNGVSRPVPQEVQDRTDEYLRALPERCSRRRS